jgi:hypothetical protein
MTIVYQHQNITPGYGEIFSKDSGEMSEQVDFYTQLTDW